MQFNGKTLLSLKGERLCLVLLSIAIIHLQVLCAISDNIKGVQARPAEQREVSGKADWLWKRSSTVTGNEHLQVQAREQLEKVGPLITASVTADIHVAVLCSCLLKVAHENPETVQKERPQTQHSDLFNCKISK